MRISFFVPPELINDKHQDKASNGLSSAEKVSVGGTQYWTYQTWQRLQKENIFCDLVTELPHEGIVILYIGDTFFKKYFTDAHLRSKSLFLVNILADGIPHPAAHLHLVQNRTHSRLLPHSLFIPHWPEPDLIPRDSKRGDRFENIFFFGNVCCLAPELVSEEWTNHLRRRTGLHFSVRDITEWHDYSNVDAIVAVRRFSRSSHLHKPASKLYNAWLAGVPFIGGRDSAYATEGHPGKNYLTAYSPQGVIKQLQRLKENKNLRLALVNNGIQASASFTQAAILHRWKKMIQEILPLRAQQWQQKSNTQRRYDALWRQAFCAADRWLIDRSSNPFVMTD